MIRGVLVPLGIGLAVFALAYAVSWPLGFALALGAGAFAIAVIARLLSGIDTEKTPDFEVQSQTGLRPSVATTAGAFRERHLSGATASRLGAVIADFASRHDLSDTEARELFGPHYADLVAGTARPTPTQVQHLLRTIEEKDRS